MNNKKIIEPEILEKKFDKLLIDGRINLLLRFYIEENKYKSEITQEQKEILEYVFSDYYPRLNADKKELNPDLLRETLNVMIEENLVYSQDAVVEIEYLPTAKGKRINEKGGWLKYLEDNNRTEKNKNRLFRIGQYSIAIAGIYYFLEILKIFLKLYHHFCK